MPDRVIGFLRFSVVTETHKAGYRSTRDQSVEDAINTILDPKRLSQRLKLFRTMPLASLANQTDMDFEIKVVTSSRLPDAIKSSLYSIASDYQFIQISELGVHDSVGDHFRSFIKDSERTISFRIDDDDALNPSHIHDLRDLANGVDDRVLTSPNGVYLQPEGDKFLVQRIHYPNNAFGIGYVSSSGKSIWDLGSHGKLPESLMQQHQRPDAWLRSIHAGSDSGARVGATGSIERYRPDEMKSQFPTYDCVNFVRLHEELGEAPASPSKLLQNLGKWASRLSLTKRTTDSIK